ncbi:MAG: D-alanine--D-alanine ligase [Ruminococcaceae bacterium]|nr:D-alanine--D-alanine ligase [Oscillospiraceae bacterium]
MRNETILVLMGGESTEREVSLRSGKAVADALRQRFEKVVELDLTRESLGKIAEMAPDCAFIALHGKGGEDGTVQGLLEWMGIPYTGPGTLASALCLDKMMTKKVLTLSGVPTPEFLCIPHEAQKDPQAAVDNAIRVLGLPLVLKANCQGSSIGVAILRERAGAAEVLSELFTYGDQILAEKFLSGTELTVPVMGNSKLLVLPPIEITSSGKFYDYASKYTPGGSRHIIPARISPEVEKRVKSIAAKAYSETGCRGLARVDMMLDEKGEPFVIEINTSPGMTETSLFPDAARAAGISFPELCETLVDLAME